MKILTIGLTIVALVAACSGSTATTGSAQGTETGACYPNSTCNAGLACLSNTCVNPGTDDGGSGDAGSDALLSIDTGTTESGPSDSGGTDARDDAGLACPGASIFHPGPETRNVGTSVPFVGRGRDVRDGAITGAKLVWIDSLEGPIGTGETFSHTFTQTGMRTATLTATGGVGKTYQDTITFMII